MTHFGHAGDGCIFHLVRAMDLAVSHQGVSKNQGPLHRPEIVGLLF